MTRLVPITALLLALAAIVSKFGICGRLHSVTVALYKADTEGNASIARSIVASQHDVQTLLVFLAFLSVILGWISLRKKLCGQALGIVSLVFSLLSFCLVFLVVF